MRLIPGATLGRRCPRDVRVLWRLLNTLAQLPPPRVVRVLENRTFVEASALSAPAALRRPGWQPVRLLRLRSDEQLVALFRAGSEEAFGVIHERYRQRLFAYTRQMLAGSPPNAAGALHDRFPPADPALPAHQPPRSPPPAALSRA